MEQAVEDFEHGLHSNLIDSVNTLDLDASFDEAVSMCLLQSLHLVSTIYGNPDYSLHLASNVINYGVR